MSGMDAARAAAALTVSTKYMGQPAANKARGRMDGSPIHEPEYRVMMERSRSSQRQSETLTSRMACWKRLIKRQVVPSLLLQKLNSAESQFHIFSGFKMQIKLVKSACIWTDGREEL